MNSIQSHGLRKGAFLQNTGQMQDGATASVEIAKLPTLAITLLRVCPWPPWERRSSGNRNPAPPPDMNILPKG